MPDDPSNIDDLILMWISEGLIRTVYDPIGRDLILFAPDDTPIELHPETMN